MSVIHKKNCFILTGSPGSGKSTLLAELAKTYCTVPEPARDVIAEQKASQGNGLWDQDRSLFIDLMLKHSIDRFLKASQSIHFFDRGIPDCIAYARYGKVDDQAFVAASNQYRYNKTVFVLAPWKEIYQNDRERTMSFEEATQFHHYIVAAYRELGYTLVEVPALGVQDRVRLIQRLSLNLEPDVDNSEH